MVVDEALVGGGSNESEEDVEDADKVTVDDGAGDAVDGAFVLIEELLELPVAVELGLLQDATTNSSVTASAMGGKGLIRVCCLMVAA